MKELTTPKTGKKIDIPLEIIEGLIKEGLSIEGAANRLEVSRSTVKRRLKEFGISWPKNKKKLNKNRNKTGECSTYGIHNLVDASNPASPDLKLKDVLFYLLDSPKSDTGCMVDASSDSLLDSPISDTGCNDMIIQQYGDLNSICHLSWKAIHAVATGSSQPTSGEFGDVNGMPTQFGDFNKIYSVSDGDLVESLFKSSQGMENLPGSSQPRSHHVSSEHNVVNNSTSDVAGKATYADDRVCLEFLF